VNRRQRHCVTSASSAVDGIPSRSRARFNPMSDGSTGFADDAMGINDTRVPPAGAGNKIDRHRRNMNRTPKWVWKQRTAIMCFLLSFHVQRMLRSMRLAVSPAPNRRKAPDQKPFPRRRRPAAIQ